jgi:hypothetical protein
MTDALLLFGFLATSAWAAASSIAAAASTDGRRASHGSLRYLDRVTFGSLRTGYWHPTRVSFSARARSRILLLLDPVDDRRPGNVS